MPNWCDNTVTLYNKDKANIDALDAELSKKNDDDGRSIGEFLNSLRPNPTGEWQYDWSVENWGTKWDASIIDWERTDDNTIWVSFETAWSPPTTLYEFLTEEGWNVEAIYHEPGMGFAGRYTSECGDEYYEYDFSSRSSIEELPSEIEEFAGLLDYHDSCAENGDFDEEEMD